jgi:tetratricopeptide (TPR) repeat protein
MQPTDKKSLFELVQAHANLVVDGIEAWGAGNFERAIELLTLALDREPAHAKARYHLALSYQASGQLHTAAGHFRQLVTQGDDKEISQAAQSALSAMDSDLKKVSSLNPAIRARAPIQPQPGIDPAWIKNNLKK